MRIWAGLWLVLGLWVGCGGLAWAELPAAPDGVRKVAVETKKKPAKKAPIPLKKKPATPSKTPAAPASENKAAPTSPAPTPSSGEKSPATKAPAHSAKVSAKKDETAKPPWFYLNLRGSLLPVGRYWGVGGKGKDAAMAKSRLLVSGGTGLTFEFAPSEHGAFGFSFDYFYMRNQYKKSAEMTAAGISSTQKNHLLDFDFASRSFWRIRHIAEFYFRYNVGFSLGLYPKSTHWYGLNLQLMPGILFLFDHVGFFFEIGAHSQALFYKKKSNYGASLGVALLMNAGPVFAF